MSEKSVAQSVFIYGPYRKYLDWCGSRICKNIRYPEDMRIRIYEDKDKEEITKLLYDAFGNKANIKQIKRYSKCYRNTFFIYEENNQILGYVGYYLHYHDINHKKERIAVIYSIATALSNRKKGIGYKLLSDTIDILKQNEFHSVYALIHFKNIASQTMFHKADFTFEGPINKLYGADAGYIVSKILNK